MISVAPKTPMSRSNSTSTNGTPVSTPAALSAKPITKIVMSKDWVLPPRPKPGRKPCDDIPSSKRKAQNRAAQRAFRERRANRVSELEEKIMEMERDRSVSEGILNNLIKNLQTENTQMKNELSTLKSENSLLRSKIRERSNTSSSLSTSSKSNSNSPERLSSIESLFKLEPQSAVPLKRKASAISMNSRSPNSKGEIDFTNAFVFKKQRKMPVLNDIITSKNSSSDSISIKQDSQSITPTASLDQTPRGSIISSNMVSSISMGGSKNTQVPSLSSILTFNNNSSIGTLTNNDKSSLTTNSIPAISNSIPFESCGFCSEDTPCVCREIETEQQLQQQREIKNIRETKLKNEIEKKEKELILELTRSAQNDDMSQVAKCTGNPGTCLQCRNDPLSTLFCKTVAEKSNQQSQKEVTREGSTSSIVLPGLSRNGSINNLTDTTSVNLSNVGDSSNSNFLINKDNSNSRCRLPSLESLKLDEAGKQFVPCADAYKTISNHLDIRNVGVNKIANNLQTKGMFVEVGSVVSCLRELDRKFSSS